ncbi:Uncharacterised protein [Sphingobacterium mizutaii]|uniref:Uncharacterized protein n=1 Tax=Sphingobacterium mizutaii TaxID=1010 RepID=A0AAJ4XEL1_9SPHI|nr:hypothetical protein SAMN05192578_11033 [Sphingobacterium mizutaii]SNV59396.1 Uncharacterised protein [Sphingobacterium mizutaii]
MIKITPFQLTKNGIKYNFNSVLSLISKISKNKCPFFASPTAYK